MNLHPFLVQLIGLNQHVSVCEESTAIALIEGFKR
jgi:hypothetical protein